MTTTTSPDALQWQDKEQELEEWRQLFSPCMRMYPDWEGEIRSEEWFRGDELQAGESLFILEKHLPKAIAIFILRVLLEDIQSKTADLAKDLPDEGREVLAAFVYPWSLPIKRLYKEEIQDVIEKATKAEDARDHFDKATWIVNAVQKQGLWDQMEYAYRLAEQAKESFYEPRNKAVEISIKEGLVGEVANFICEIQEVITTLETIQEDIRLLLGELKALIAEVEK
jgi:hypothetical protein